MRCRGGRSDSRTRLKACFFLRKSDYLRDELKISSMAENLTLRMPAILYSIFRKCPEKFIVCRSGILKETAILSDPVFWLLSRLFTCEISLYHNKKPPMLLVCMCGLSLFGYLLLITRGAITALLSRGSIASGHFTAFAFLPFAFSFIFDLLMCG